MIFLNSFIVCSSCKRKFVVCLFVDEETIVLSLKEYRAITVQYFSKTEHCKTFASDSEVSTRPNSIQFLLSSLFQLLLIQIKYPFPQTFTF